MDPKYQNVLKTNVVVCSLWEIGKRFCFAIGHIRQWNILLHDEWMSHTCLYRTSNLE